MAEGQDRANGRHGVTPAPRVEIVDALRAFALIGILQVNIQSFVWGASEPLGYFPESPRAVDAATFVLVATLVSGKFFSIFAFLFGFGFVMQWRALRRFGLNVAQARRAYRRRLWFLLAVGILHGVLLYFGDILTLYAVAGFVLLLYAAVDAGSLVASARRWWLAFAAAAGVLSGLVELMRRAAIGEETGVLPPDAVERFFIFTRGSYLDQLGVRAADFITANIGMAPFLMPQVVALFLLGALAARLGWLRRPQRHPQVWRIATWIGAVALPVSAIAAWLHFANVVDAPDSVSGLDYLLTTFGSLVACLYVAAWMRLRDRAPVRRLVAWLAPAGRMPLTNYLLQSLLMGGLLSGWGLGLGAGLHHAELALLGLAIALAQIALSHWWIGRFGQGPLERLWRAWTYHGLERIAVPLSAAPPPASSTLSQTPR
jgi:uncharacterized protein